MFNVFKRPMFKRGGPSKGTGIMSHVERRPNYSIGGGVIQGNPMGSRTGFQTPSFNVNLGARTPIPTQSVFKTAADVAASQSKNLATKGTGILSNLFRGPRNIPVPLGYSGPPNLMGAGAVTSTAAMLAGPAAVAGIAYLNRPRTLEELEIMKQASQYGIMDETASQEDIEAYQKALIEARKSGTPIEGTNIGLLSSEEEIAKAIEASKIEEEYEGPKEEQLKGFFSPMDKIIEDKKKAAAEKAVKETGTKDETYTESDKKTEIEKEAELIKNILKDDNLTKAELAFAVGKALQTPGSISDKIEVAGKEGQKLAIKKRKSDRDATLLAYKAVKEKEIAKAKAATPTGTQKAVQEFASLSEKVRQGTATNAEKAVFNAYKKGVFREDEDTTVKALALQFAKNPETLTDLEADIKKLSAIKNRDEREEEKLQTAIKNYTIITNVIKEGGLGSVYGLKEGGRVMRALGTPKEGEITKEDSLEITETPGESNVFPTKTVEKLSFAELRDSLPQEITNDIVQLIANSTEALQDFSYIRTQKDINDFNLKYGVNLVLPPQKS